MSFPSAAELEGGSRVVVLLGAAGPAGRNFVECLLADPALEEGVDLLLCDADGERLWLYEPLRCSRGARIHYDAHPDWRLAPERRILALRSYLDGRGIRQLWHAQPDPLVRVLARTFEFHPARETLARLYMPAIRLIAAAQDKSTSATIWANAGIRLDRPVVVYSPADARDAGERFGYPYWIRATEGAGARLSARIRDEREAVSWATFARAAFPCELLVAQAYLPGRDWGVSLLYYSGCLLGRLVRERLEYIYPQHSISGRTGTPVAARIALPSEEWAAQVAASRAAAALEALADAAGGVLLHGVFGVDLREDRGVTPQPRPTEVNAGRFFTTSNASLGTGANLVALYARVGLELEDPVHRLRAGSNPPEVAALEEPSADWHGARYVRHLDMGAMLTRATFPAVGGLDLEGPVDGAVVEVTPEAPP